MSCLGQRLDNTSDPITQPEGTTEKDTITFLHCKRLGTDRPVFYLFFEAKFLETFVSF